MTQNELEGKQGNYAACERDASFGAHIWNFFSVMKIFCAANGKMRDENISTMIFLEQIFIPSSFDVVAQNQRYFMDSKKCMEDIVAKALEFSINRNAQQWPLITYFKYFACSRNYLTKKKENKPLPPTVCWC